MTTRVAVVGGLGKLGSIITATVDAEPGFEVSAVLSSRDSIDGIDGADLVVDATHPGVSAEIVRAALDRNNNVLVATSGWSAERIAALRPRVAEAGAGVVIIPNFSLGSVVGSAIAAAASRFFPSAEIVEAHRDGKVDSPSGTAVRTAELIAQARRNLGPVSAPHVDQRARGQQVASVPVHSLRRPGVVAKQEAILSGPGEALSIVHDTIDPAQAYPPGIRLALPAARDASGLIVGLDSFLDISFEPALPLIATDDAPNGGAPGQVARATGA